MILSEFIETVHRLSHRYWAEAAARLGVTHSEFEYLRAIKNQEARKTDKDDHGQHLQDVVAEMGVKKASASAMVLKLEQRGLVRRVPCQFDARAQHILLTPAGFDLLRKGEALYEEVGISLLSAFPDTVRGDLEVAIAALAAAQ
ncbi:MarR family winged helix-turn-helix transcriptional regulator [Roseobacteraceae bacterium NS-SX3]